MIFEFGFLSEPNPTGTERPSINATPCFSELNFRKAIIAVATPVVDPKASLATATPAASIDVSVSAKLTEMQVKKDTTPVTDKVLLEKIKAKIASGTFEIDYQQISQAMLHESLAAIGAKSN